MADNDIALMAHLLRRAGFGATREELEGYAAKGYETTVEELLYPEKAPAALSDEDLIRRYHIDENAMQNKDSAQTYWLYRMVNTRRPLEEKLTLFWHGVFATAYSKLERARALLRQLDMFRRFGLGNFNTLLLELSMDPAMIFWLDNKDNHDNAYNENFGRELLELFSMGVGNYTEQDVYEASRAFTGWTMQNAAYITARVSRASNWPYGKFDWQFLYRDEDHDDGEKTFLGHTGVFNGQDIIDIVCRQPATARFLSRHLYNFFVADEPQVPAWETAPPRDQAAIDTLVEAYFESNYDIRSMLRVLFNSDFFKNARFAKVKSPAEVVVGTVRLAGGFRFPAVEDIDLANQMAAMGQELINPPSVEGWHTGAEWVTTGSLVDRVNFAANQMGDLSKPGISSIIERIRDRGDSISPESLVDACLDLMGPLTIDESTRQELIRHAATQAEIRFDSEEEYGSSSAKVGEILQLIVATREYQLA